MIGTRPSTEFERDSRRMQRYGLGYAVAGLLLVVLSYQATGWPRWPLGILGWLLLLAGAWTILFRIFTTWLVAVARRSGLGRSHH